MGLEGTVEEMNKHAREEAVHLCVAHVSSKRVQVCVRHLETDLGILEERVQMEKK